MQERVEEGSSRTRYNLHKGKKLKVDLRGEADIKNGYLSDLQQEDSLEDCKLFSRYGGESRDDILSGKR